MNIKLEIEGDPKPGDYLAVRAMNFGQDCGGTDSFNYTILASAAVVVQLQQDDYADLRADCIELSDPEDDWQQDVVEHQGLEDYLNGARTPEAYLDFCGYDLLGKLEMASGGTPKYVANSIDAVSISPDTVRIQGKAYPFDSTTRNSTR